MHRNIKYIAFALCFTVLVGCKQNEVTTTNPEQDATEATVEEPSSVEEIPTQEQSSSATSIPLPNIDCSSWNLILVNAENPIPENYEIKTAKTINAKEVDERILDPLEYMIASAKEDGIEIFVDSAFRSVEYQKEIMDKNINRHLDKGYSEEAAKMMAENYISVPGYSEHHTGLAVDIITPSYQILDVGYAKTDAAIWLKDHAADFGFILRYPKDKIDITGIEFEPWHYRYVGKEHSQYMMNNNLCLEEYLKLND